MYENSLKGLKGVCSLKTGNFFKCVHTNNNGMFFGSRPRYKLNLIRFMESDGDGMLRTSVWDRHFS